MTHTISWEALNSKNIIFGTAFQNNGVAYTLRAPSAGSSDAYPNGGTPQSNEWDKILDKDNEYIKDWSREYSWGQDTRSDLSSHRAVRGYTSARFWRNRSAIFSYSVGFRPVLEVLNPDTLGADGLKAVVLDLNGGSIGDATGTVNIVVKNGESFTAPASNGLTRPAGNTNAYFWWQGNDGNFYLPGTGVPAGVTSLTAQWTALTYTVTLNANGGVIANGKDITSYTYGDGATLPTANDMTREGYTFKGWYTDSGFSGSPVSAISNTDMGNKEFYAKWDANIYAVTLNTNGGAIASGKDITSYTYSDGATLPTANDMTREGYTFKGWYTDSGFSGSPVTAISNTDMGNKEFYAKWTRNTTPIIPGDTVNYIVEHYKASNNGYTLEETEYLGDKIGSNVTAEPKIYTGYTYNPDAVGSVTKGTLKKIISAADIVTLKLYYDLTVYNVIVENDGNGSAYAAPASATMGEKITLTSTANSGYRFKEWQIVSGDVTISGDAFTMPAGNVTVKALFERKSGGGSGGATTYYTLTFETNGGSSIQTISTTSSKTIDLSSYVPTLGGYDFTGWYSDKALTQKITEIKLNGSNTVYAGWVKRDLDAGNNPFIDINPGDWFYNDVMFVYEKALMSGTSANTFAPYGNITRGQLAVILYRMEGSPAVERKNSLTDVEYGPGTVWFYDAATWAHQNGIMEGSGNNKFAPDDSVTREQLASILYRYAQVKGYNVTNTGNLDGFTDKENISDWAREAIRWVISCGIMNGRENNLFDPKGIATRAEVAVMLHRFIEKQELKPFITPSGATGWSKATDGDVHPDS